MSVATTKGTPTKVGKNRESGDEIRTFNCQGVCSNTTLTCHVIKVDVQGSQDISFFNQIQTIG